MDLATLLMAQQAPSAGWASLGEAIGQAIGKPRGTELERAKTFGTLSDMELKLEKARRATEEGHAKRMQAKAYMDAGQPDMARALMGDFVQDRGRFQEQGFRQSAADAGVRRYGADNPNAHLFGVASGPQSMFQTMGQGAHVADRFDPDAPIELSEIGQALVGDKLANAAQSGAQGEAAMVRALAAAGKDAAHAGVYEAQEAAGGYNPNTGRRRAALSEPDFSGVIGQTSDSVPAGGDPMLAQAQAAIAQGADPEAVRKRLMEMGRADLAGSL